MMRRQPTGRATCDESPRCRRCVAVRARCRPRPGDDRTSPRKVSLTSSEGRSGGFASRTVQSMKGRAPAVRSRAGQWWLAGFVTVMLAVPIAGLFSSADRVAFGWQMFSRVGPLVSYEVERNSQRESLTLAEWVVSDRRELGAHDHLPAHVCAYDGAATAVWTITEHVPAMETVEKRHECRD